MKIGVCAGKRADEENVFDIIGTPGLLAPLRKLQRKIVSNGGEYEGVKYIRIVVADISHGSWKKPKRVPVESVTAAELGEKTLGDMSKKELAAVIKLEGLDIEAKGNKGKIVSAIEEAWAAKIAAAKAEPVEPVTEAEPVTE